MLTVDTLLEKQLTATREDLWPLRPDSKTQVTIELRRGIVPSSPRFHFVVLSIQHAVVTPLLHVRA